MKELWKNFKGWQKGGVIIGGILVVVIIVVAVILALGAEPNVKINFSDKVSIPAAELKKIREKLAVVISNNTKNFSKSTTYIGDARDYSETLNDNNSVANFIVDFDAISESYKVVVNWPKSDDDVPNVIISCPLLESKFPKTPCNTEINSSSDIMGYLPYTAKLSDGSEYKITGEYVAEEAYLKISTAGNKEEALTAAREFVNSIGFDASKILFYVPAGQYIQANYSNTNDTNVNKNLPYFVPGKYYVYPVVDENKNITAIYAKLAACTESQSIMADEVVQNYLSTHEINYPVEFEYCAY